MLVSDHPADRFRWFITVIRGCYKLGYSSYECTVFSDFRFPLLPFTGYHPGVFKFVVDHPDTLFQTDLCLPAHGL